MAEPRTWETEDWVTTHVTPLDPGWHAVYNGDDGREFHERVPALALQELRFRTCYRRRDGSPTEVMWVQELRPPYETRITPISPDLLFEVVEASNYADRMVWLPEVEGG